MKDSTGKPIASLTYYMTERTIDWFQQKNVEVSYTISLFEETIYTTEQTFSLEHVHDVSYRPFSDGSGLFYLHTNRGVFTFGVKNDPKEFIRSYRGLKGDPFAF